MNAESKNVTDTRYGNRFDCFEFAGAFGDLGTLIPFIVGYVNIAKLEPLGVFFTFGIFLIASGLFYKTPIPVQPMKAIGAAAIAQTASVTPGMIWGAGLFTGVFWLAAGLTGKISVLSKLAAKPVIRGIMLGLGILFMRDGVNNMKTAPSLSFVALVLIFLMLANRRVPAMLVILTIGIFTGFLENSAILAQFGVMSFDFRPPSFALGSLSFDDVIKGVFVLGLPQLPLTFGNAVIAITDENNRLFPQHPVTENRLALTQGIMNLISPLFGGIPLCHGVGGMAGHVRFGARTGGSLIILGSILTVGALFFSNSIVLLLDIFPKSILGVILFFAGLELAVSARDIGAEKNDFYILLVTAGFAFWSIGFAFVVGMCLQFLVKKEIVKF